MLTTEQRDELKTLIVEYGIAAVMEGSENRRRQINRIVNFVDDIAASAAPAEGPEPTGDELRKLVREIRDASGGPSDAPQPADYVLGGWRAAIATAPTMSEAARDVLAERRRQVEVEGWTPEHDDKHISGEMAKAAAAYALNAGNVAPGWPQDPLRAFCEPPTFWPWNREWWKPDTLRWMLVKAGALILAEIERIDRAAAKGGSDA